MTTTTIDAERITPARPLHERSLLWKTMQVPFWMACTLGLDLKVYGRRNVPREGGVLLLANHQSFLDPVLVSVKLDRAVSFLARHGLFKPWGFRWFIRNLNAFPIQQGKGDVGAMKQSIALLKQGAALLIFPEGGRTEHGELQPIAAGAALVVKRAKVPVVPVAIEGAFESWPIHRPLPRPGRVRVMYGEPTLLHELDGREIVARIDADLRRMIGELRAMEGRP